jgi:hypothetical protein
MAVFFLPALARRMVYADAHGGAARVTNLTNGGSVHAHTNLDTGWLAGSSAGYEWKQGFAGGQPLL